MSDTLACDDRAEHNASYVLCCADAGPFIIVAPTYALRHLIQNLGKVKDEGSRGCVVHDDFLTFVAASRECLCMALFLLRFGARLQRAKGTLLLQHLVLHGFIADSDQVELPLLEALLIIQRKELART